MKNRNKKTNNSDKKKKLNSNSNSNNSINSITNLITNNTTDSTTDIYLYTSKIIFKFTQYTNATINTNTLAFSWEATHVNTNTTNTNDNALKCISEGNTITNINANIITNNYIYLIGAMFSVNGSIKYTNLAWINKTYSCSASCAKNVHVDIKDSDILQHEFNNISSLSSSSKTSIEKDKLITITSSGFSDNIPIDNLVVEIVIPNASFSSLPTPTSKQPTSKPSSSSSLPSVTTQSSSSSSSLPSQSMIFIRGHVNMMKKFSKYDNTLYTHHIDNIMIGRISLKIPDKTGIDKPISQSNFIDEAYQFTSIQVFYMLFYYSLILFFTNYFKATSYIYSLFILVGRIDLVILLYVSAIQIYASFDRDTGTRTFYINGWNAWSFTGSILQGRRIPLYTMPHAFVRAFHDGAGLMINLARGSMTNRTHFQSMNGFQPVVNDFMASDMFTLLADRVTRAGIVIGFLRQKLQFGCIGVNRHYDRLSIHVACDNVVKPQGSSLTTDWVVIDLNDILPDEPFAAYMDLVAKAHGINKTKDSSIASNGSTKQASATSKLDTTPPAGWCSWYHFFANITEKDLIENIDQMVAIKKSCGLDASRQNFNLFQIDDGYQNAWGDWLELNPSKFPSNSMINIVKKIKSSNLSPGLWLAPFACDKFSNIAKNNYHWILKSNKNALGPIPANSANCGKWFYGLDVTNEEVQAYIKKFITVVTKVWGFSYLKIDFLYAAALAEAQSSYSDKSLTRAQAMQIGMKVIRDAAGSDTFILGCGAPMGSVIGHVEANRVSADAGLSWFPEFPLPYWDKWNLPCARSMIRNTVNRMSMHGRWWINDPDCMLLRNTTHFSTEELIGIATAKAMSGGSFIISDDLKTITPERIRIAQQLLPPTNVSAIALDLLDKEMPEVLRLSLNNSDKNNIIYVDDFGIIEEEDNRMPWGDNSVDSNASDTGKWTLFGLCNWGDSNKVKKCDLTSIFVTNSNINTTVLLHVYDFWFSSYSNAVVKIENGKPTELIVAEYAIEKHSAKILAMRVQYDPLSPLYLGSNLHFSCGLEVARYDLFYGQATDSNSNSSRPSYLICTIYFEDGIIRDQEWGGFFMMLLPSYNSNNNHNIRITGTAGISAIHQTNVANGPFVGSVWKILVGKNANANSLGNNTNSSSSGSSSSKKNKNIADSNGKTNDGKTNDYVTIHWSPNE